MVAFNTPQNERSFSQLVDDVILASGRPALLRNIVAYANMTIRECQARGLFHRDLIEDTISAVQTTPYVWTRPAQFRALKTAKYATQCVYPPLQTPGKRQRNEEWYYYAADDYFVFKGPILNEDINIAYYTWAKPLMYFQRFGENSATYPGGPYTVRPAYYDLALDQWQYLITTDTPNDYKSTTGDATVDAAKQLLVSNWLTREWYEVVLEGTKAKIWASANDTRSQISYALYTQGREALRTSVGREGDDND